MTHIRIISTIAFVILCSCADELGQNVLVRTIHSGKPVDQATVYVKFGTDQDPQLPLAQYDLAQRADGTGECYFKNLPEGKVYFFSRGFDQDLQRYVQGGIGIKMNASSNNKLTIQLY